MDKNNIDKLMTQVVHNMPSELSEYIKSKTLEIQPLFFNKGTSNLELVVDTNILFQEVRSYMTNNSSFFLKIADSPYVKFFAPSKIEQELIDKIKLKFPKDKKTKDLNLSECIKCAQLFLQKIEINDKYSQTEYSKAYAHLKDRDVNDVIL